MLLSISMTVICMTLRGCLNAFLVLKQGEMTTPKQICTYFWRFRNAPDELHSSQWWEMLNHHNFRGNQSWKHTYRIYRRADFQKPEELAVKDMLTSFRRGSWSESTWQTCGSHGWEGRSQCSILPFMSPYPSFPHRGHQAEGADTKFWHWSWVHDLAFRAGRVYRIPKNQVKLPPLLDLANLSFKVFFPTKLEPPFLLSWFCPGKS